jgi:hypothetical protein
MIFAEAAGIVVVAVVVEELAAVLVEVIDVVELCWLIPLPPVPLDWPPPNIEDMSDDALPLLRSSAAPSAIITMTAIPTYIPVFPFGGCAAGWTTGSAGA